MFMQVITGRAPDADAVLARDADWVENLSPGARGWLGTTAGATGDGRVVIGVRFASEEDARANSERPEQGAWWAETAKLFDGEPEFAEGSEIDFLGRGGSNEAGFVQVMRGHADRDELHDVERDFTEQLERIHPALIGATRVWTGDRDYVQFNFFTDEDLARKGEQAMNEAPELGAIRPRFEQLMAGVEYFDLSRPIFDSPLTT